MFRSTATIRSASRIAKDGEPYIQVTVSAPVRTNGFLSVPPQIDPSGNARPPRDADDSAVMTMTLGMKLSDLDRGEPQNFDVITRPSLVPLPTPR